MISLPTVDALNAISIPVPCTVAWDSMCGNDRTRFCDQCKQNVHDVSELSRADAIQLVTSGEQTPCLRIFRRPDGRVMTADCATRRERVWKWLHKRAPWAAAAFAFVFMAGCGWGTTGAPCTAGVPVRPNIPSDDAVQSVTGGTAAVKGD